MNKNKLKDIPYGLRPFTDEPLEEVLKHPEWVRTRDGGKVMQMAHFTKALEYFRVVFLPENEISPKFVSEEGILWKNVESTLDLFLLKKEPVKRTCWIIEIIGRGLGNIEIHGPYASREEALKFSFPGYKVTAVKEITITEGEGLMEEEKCK